MYSNRRFRDPTVCGMNKTSCRSYFFACLSVLYAAGHDTYCHFTLFYYIPDSFSIIALNLLYRNPFISKYLCFLAIKSELPNKTHASSPTSRTPRRPSCKTNQKISAAAVPAEFFCAHEKSAAGAALFSVERVERKENHGRGRDRKGETVLRLSDCSIARCR